MSGWTRSYGNGALDGLLLKYDMNGALQYYKTRGGTSNDRTRGIEIDDGNVWMAMYTKSYGSGEGDTVLLKYRASDGYLLGEGIWGNTGDDNVNTSLCTDNNHVYMVGKTTSLGQGGYEAIILKVNKL
jgi:hypothetical protein